MGVVAVAIVVVCAALYTVFELIERRKQRNFEEQLRQYIKEHKGDGSVSRILPSAMTRRCCGLLLFRTALAVVRALRLASTSIRQRPVSARLGGAAT